MGIIPASDKALELAAIRFGSLAEQTPDSLNPRRMAEQRRLLWGVMHRLHADDQQVITRLAAGHSHEEIARALGISRVAITERIPLVFARVRWWIERPFVMEDDDLEAHLAKCPFVARPQRVVRRIVSYLGGKSLREIAAHDGCQLSPVARSINRGIAEVTVRTAPSCATCRGIVRAERHRRLYRPPTFRPESAR